MAIDIVCMICTFSLGTLDSTVSYRNMRMVDYFLSGVHVEYEAGKNHAIKDAISRFCFLCGVFRHTCDNDHECRSVLEGILGYYREVYTSGVRETRSFLEDVNTDSKIISSIQALAGGEPDSELKTACNKS